MRLIDDRKIVEIDNQKYFESIKIQKLKIFSHFSRDIFEKAFEKYKSSF